MKVLVVLLLVVLAVAAYVVIARAMRSRSAASARWELEERSERGELVVRAVRPGVAGEPLVVGAAAFDDPEFDMRIEELRSEGRAKVIALNSGR